MTLSHGHMPEHDRSGTLRYACRYEEGGACHSTHVGVGYVMREALSKRLGGE